MSETSETSNFFWTIYPVLQQSKEDGPVVGFKWGIDHDPNHPETEVPKIWSTPEDAFDLAVSIFELFLDENGEPQRPEPFQYPENEEHKEISRKFLEIFENGFHEEFRISLGSRYSGLYSFPDYWAWVESGKPNPAFSHAYVEHPEDHVVICSICGEWYSTRVEDEESPSLACLGKPDKRRHQTIYTKDPRRSPLQRELERINKLLVFMESNEATEEEMKVLQDKLSQVHDAWQIEVSK